jgi:predicted metal-dependent HD superfamily phosphohydrolase
MRQRWNDLLASLGVGGKAVEEEFASLTREYNSGNRYYHNLEHIRAILDTISPLEHRAVDFQAIQLAAWYHDIVYDPERVDNEEKSAEYGYQSLLELGLSEERANRVRELILVTADHRPPEDDIDAQILVDADLAPLAIDEEQFRRHAVALRHEFSQMPEEEFNASRKDFLTHIISREKIYSTEEMHEALEDKARRNIQQSLAALA